MEVSASVLGASAVCERGVLRIFGEQGAPTPDVRWLNQLCAAIDTQAFSAVVRYAEPLASVTGRARVKEDDVVLNICLPSGGRLRFPPGRSVHVMLAPQRIFEEDFRVARERGDHVVVVGGAEQGFVHERGIAQDRIHIVGVCVDTAVFHQDAAITDAIPGDRPCALWSGSRHDTDGMERALAAYRQRLQGTPELALIMLIAPAYLYEQRCSLPAPPDFAAAGCVFAIEGHLGAAERASVYRRAQYVLMPDAFGDDWIAITEAAHCGVPCVPRGIADPMYVQRSTYERWNRALVHALNDSLPRDTVDCRDALMRYDRSMLSQNGEDGMIGELFSRIGVQSGTFVEFGVESGVECNAALLVKAFGWRGLFMDGNPDMVAILRSNYAAHDGVHCVEAMITRENILGLFKQYGVAPDVDLLSIDVDGNDYHLWRALSSYRPRVVCIEFNPAYAPPERWVMQYRADHCWNGSNYFGASLASLVALGEQLGYVFLGNTVVNAMFVRADLHEASGFAAVDPTATFIKPPWRHWPQDGPFDRL